MLIRIIFLVALFAAAPRQSNVDTGSCIDPLGCAVASPLDTGSCIDPQGQPCTKAGGEMDSNG